MAESILNILSESIRDTVVKLTSKAAVGLEAVTEIRLRINSPVSVSYVDSKVCTGIKTGIKSVGENRYIVTQEDIDTIIARVTDYSLYAFDDEVRQGFITIRGGHRVGLAGQAVLRDGKVMNLKNISFLNIRLAHQIVGCGTRILPYILCNGRLMDTLIISPPGCGKTTLLRDIVRLVSDGDEFRKGVNVGVVDERSEIAGSYMGKPQLDVGRRTDVLDCCPKAEGMLMLLRSMNPQVIAVDEIGSREDIEAISYVSNCGCSIIATAHGDSIDDIRTRPVLRKLVEERLFERYIVLGQSNGVGTVECVFDGRGNELLCMELCAAQ